MTAGSSGTMRMMARVAPVTVIRRPTLYFVLTIFHPVYHIVEGLLQAFIECYLGQLVYRQTRRPPRREQEEREALPSWNRKHPVAGPASSRSLSSSSCWQRISRLQCEVTTGAFYIYICVRKQPLQRERQNTALRRSLKAPKIIL